MSKEFTQIAWNPQLADDCEQIVRLAVREDLDRSYDWTTLALIGARQPGEARIIARQAGVIAGLPALELALETMEASVSLSAAVADGDRVTPGDVVAALSGSARDLLTAERLLLNLLGRLSGIATLTRRYVDAVEGLRARIYDTRKTTPGYRRLEKYAVRCGGGVNHRTGLFDAVLVKDNHLALAAEFSPDDDLLAGVVDRVRRFLEESAPPGVDTQSLIIEVEVDSLEQLDQVLPAAPDIVLLDNMTTNQLRESVERRDRCGAPTELEASGGVNLQQVRAVAEAGVERISVGALTHSVANLDVALDWQPVS